MKILLATNGTQLNMPTVDLACYLANISKSALTGVFLEDVTSGAYLLNDHRESTSATGTGLAAVPAAEAIKRACNSSIIRFKEACIVRETSCKVYRDRGVPYSELLMETRFADLLVLDAGMNFDGDKETPSDFVEKILMNAECPVIVAPPNNIAVDQICFTYNGSSSSVYAMKQFTYLFPGFRNKKINLVEVKENGTLITEKFRINEWLRDHYDDFDNQLVEGEEGEKLPKMMLSKENCMFVMGAFGRNAISHFFKRSHAEQLLQLLSQPLFIAHSGKN